MRLRTEWLREAHLWASPSWTNATSLSAVKRWRNFIFRSTFRMWWARQAFPPPEASRSSPAVGYPVDENMPYGAQPYPGSPLGPRRLCGVPHPIQPCGRKLNCSYCGVFEDSLCGRAGATAHDSWRLLRLALSLQENWLSHRRQRSTS